MNLWENPRAAHLLLAGALLGASLGAACGGGGVPQAKSSASQAPKPGAAAAPPAPDAGATTVAPAPSAPAAPTANTEIVQSKMLADIKAIGIDLSNPGDLSKLELSKKKKIMPFFVKALGMSGCDGCHVAGDFKADTHNK